MRAKKSLGQHFLKSERALSVIIEAGDVCRRDSILEIGPGTGALTKKLLETDAKVVAVEKDTGLYEFLKQKYEKEISSGQLILVHDDILKFDLSKLEARSYKLVANIPYNLTGAILKKFLETDHQPERMVLLLQKEVAERIVSRKSKLGFDAATETEFRHGKESILSISIKAYGVPRYVETVKAGSFVPMPKVDSAIIAIENISKAFFQKMVADTDVETECRGVEKKFFDMVRAGFKSKRKKLSSNLSTVFEKDRVEKAFLALGLDENLRAEDVTIENWKKISNLLLN